MIEIKSSDLGGYFVYHPGTGTVMQLVECVLIDPDDVDYDGFINPDATHFEINAISARLIP